MRSQARQRSGPFSASTRARADISACKAGVADAGAPGRRGIAPSRPDVDGGSVKVKPDGAAPGTGAAAAGAPTRGPTTVLVASGSRARMSAMRSLVSGWLRR